MAADKPNLGILYADESDRGITHPFFVLILNAILREAQARGYNITFINPVIEAEGETYAQRCAAANVAGVCLVCLDFKSPHVKALIDSGIPCVTIDHIF